MTNSLQTRCWPAARLGEAIEALAQAVELPITSAISTQLPSARLIPPEEKLNECIEGTAASLGLEAKPVSASYAEAEFLIKDCAPGLLQLQCDGEPVFLCVICRHKTSVEVLAPGGARARLTLGEVLAALRDPLDALLVAEMDRMLDEVRLGGGTRGLASASILRERLGALSVSGCWVLRVPKSDSARRQARPTTLISRLLIFMVTQAAGSARLIGA